VSKDCRDLLGRLLKTSIADRLTSEEALVHPWVTGKTAVGKLTAPKIDPSIRNSLMQFNRNCQLQSEILELLRNCGFLTPRQGKAVSDAFEEMDINADGTVTLEELYQSLCKVDSSITQQDCKSIMMSIDANKNGVMEYDELLSTRINRKLISKEERLRKVFKYLDKDESNTLTADEIMGAVSAVNTSITLENCKEMIKGADINKDGVSDYEEWLKAFL
jgi:Ca2+-binding EF-hand superfamily protein